MTTLPMPALLPLHGRTADLGPGIRISLGPAHTYQLNTLIAEAGCGAVWQATWCEVGKPVAIKTLRHDRHQLPATSRAIQRQALLREGEYLSRLRHRHLVQSLHRGLHEGEPVLVLEHLHESLSQWLRQHANEATEQWPCSEVIRWVQHSATALSVLHAAGLRHLDLKPANLLLTEPKPLGQWLKLADFGAALPLTTTLHPFFGTPGWLAPEQCQAVEKDDQGALLYQSSAASDAYALGLLIFRLLTGGPTQYAQQVLHQLQRLGPAHLPELLASPGAGALTPTDEAALSAACGLGGTASPSHPNVRAEASEVEADFTWLADGASNQTLTIPPERPGLATQPASPSSSPPKAALAARIHLSNWVRALCAPTPADRPVCGEVAKAMKALLWS